MKMISAVIRPSKLDDLRDALAGLGISGNKVSEVTRFRKCAPLDASVAMPSVTEALSTKSISCPRLKINIAVTTADSDKALETLCQAAVTDATGNGEIVFTSLDHAVRVRTGEVDGGAR